MAIAAVNGVNLTHGYNAAFTGKKSSKNVSPAEHGGSSTALKSVPVIIMLAMNPATLNSGVPEKYMPMNSEQLTEVVAQIPTTDVSTINLMEVTGAKKIENPFKGIKYFDDVLLQDIKPAYSNGEKFSLVLAGHYGDGKDNNIVRKVYFVKDGETRPTPMIEPSFITELVYHNIDDAFLGVKVKKPVYDSHSVYKGAILREYRLDDESAQFLLDLRTNDTEWNNKTNIKFSITESARVMPPIDAK